MKTFVRTALFALSIACLLMGCRLKDVRTVTLSVADARCAECAKVLIRALAGIGEVDPNATITVREEDHRAFASWKPHAKNNTAAVSAVVVRYDKGEVDVTYDSLKLAIKNLEFAIAEAGYEVQTQPCTIAADSAARAALPEACRAHRPTEKATQP